MSKGIDWKKIEREYTSSKISVRALAELHGISDTAIHKKAKAEGWQKFDGIKKRKNIKPKSLNDKSELINQEIPQADVIGNKQEASENRFVINLLDYSLNDKQIKFVETYIRTGDRLKSYKEAGYTGTNDVAYISASRMLRTAKIAKPIQDALDLRQVRTEITVDSVLVWMSDILNADPNELVEHRRVNCRHCWGKGHQYQWIDEVEYDEAAQEAAAKDIAEPSCDGGFNFDKEMDPNPDCPKCRGKGVGSVLFKDTRDLSRQARRLYAGIKQTKNGTEIMMNSQIEVAKMLARYLGMQDSELTKRALQTSIEKQQLEIQRLKNILEGKGDATVNALSELMDRLSE